MLVIRFGSFHIGLALALLAGIADVSRGGELPDGWVTIFEAATAPYYREPYYNYASRNAAVAKLFNIAQNGRPKQKEAAEAILKQVELHENQKIRRHRFNIPGEVDEQWGKLKTKLQAVLPKTESLDTDDWKLFRESISPYSIFSTNKASEEQLGVDLNWQARDTIMQDLLAVRQRTSDRELKPSGVIASVSHDGANRTIWSTLTNVSKNRFTNVLVVLKFRYRKDEWSPQYVFLRAWNPGETIWPRGIYRIPVLPAGLPGVKPDADLDCRVEFWSDQGHSTSKKAKTVCFFDLRAPLFKAMVHTGARYFHSSSDRALLLSFTKVKSAGDYFEVEATASELNQAATRSPIVKNLKGRWKFQNFTEEEYSNAVEIRIPMTDTDAKPIRIKSDLPGIADKIFAPSADFLWTDEMHGVIWNDKLDIPKVAKGKLPMRRLPDAP